MREAWKQYYLTGIPKPWFQQILNFVRVTMAESQASFLDDEEAANNKLAAVKCSLSPADIGNLLDTAYSQLSSRSKDAEAVDERPNRRLNQATKTAVTTLRLQALPSIQCPRGPDRIPTYWPEPGSGQQQVGYGAQANWPELGAEAYTRPPPAADRLGH